MIPEAAVTTPEAPAPVTGPARLRILVADSSEGDRGSLKALLRRINADVEVLEAPNGPMAERILRERGVDIAFIDRRLPGFDGRWRRKRRKRIAGFCLCLLAHRQCGCLWRGHRR